MLSPSLSALLLSAHASPLLTNSVLLLNSHLLHLSLFFFFFLTFGNLSLMPPPSLLSSIFSHLSCLLSSSPLLDFFPHTLLSLFSVISPPYSLLIVLRLNSSVALLILSPQCSLFCICTPLLLLFLLCILSPLSSASALLSALLCPPYSHLSFF